MANLVQRVLDPDRVAVIFFDMDHTLIQNDCDVSWKAYLYEKGQVGVLDWLESKWHFMRYRKGKLNRQRFFRYQLRQFRGKTPAQMATWLRDHYELKVKLTIYAEAKQVLLEARELGLPRVLLTATNREIAAPLAEDLAMDELVATELAQEQGRYSGGIVEPPCIGEHKVAYMRRYMEPRGETLEHCSYWGDSVSDIPALEQVGFPVACNPADFLRATAQKRGWPVLDFASVD